MHKNKNIFHATRNALAGLRVLIKENSVKREIALLLSSLALFVWEQNTITAGLIFLALFLIAVESLNTAIELLCDHVTPATDPTIKKIKDLGAAAVFIIFFSILFLAGLYIIKNLPPDFNHRILSSIQKSVAEIKTNMALYGFYIGTTMLSLLFLRNGRWLAAKIVFLLGLIWTGFHDSLFGLLQHMGVDSFQEAISFETSEAFFWIKTFFSQVKFRLSLRAIFFYSLFAAFSYFLLSSLLHRIKLSTKQSSYIKFSVSSIFIVVAAYQSTNGYIATFFAATNSYRKVTFNFNTEPPATNSRDDRLNVFLYIGESTSAMHMSLYGYQRDTSPRLSNLAKKPGGLIVFSDVFSTHTHTSPSLLEALSIGIHESDQYRPIDERKRVSIIDILKNSGVHTRLFSNQGSTGTWNQASSIIFKNSKNSFSTSASALGNSETLIKKPWDEEFFDASITPEVLNKSDGRLLVFHSYAGHGGYLDNIPPGFRKPVDDNFEKNGKLSVVGTKDSLDNVEAYDSAVRYVDFSVARAIEAVKKSTKPWVFVYFSDHGESPYPNLGHDSSKFIHEMARVPFVIFFNEAARTLVPEIVSKYQRLANNKNKATLAQLPYTLLDLLGIELSDSSEALHLPLIGQPFKPYPIVVRKSGAGITAVHLNTQPPLPTQQLIDRTDTATQHYNLVSSENTKNPSICYRRSNTIAKVVRGKLVASCLEIDAVVDEHGEVFIYHPPAENTGLTLNQVLGFIGKENKISLWIDAKNLLTKHSCDAIRAKLIPQVSSQTNILIELPSGSYNARKEIGRCLANLRADGRFVSYYVPTDLAIECSKRLNSGEDFKGIASCKRLQSDLISARSSGMYTDISFDYNGIRAIEHMKISREFSWNTWHVDASEFIGIQPSRFRMVILKNDDPNNI